MPRTSAKLIIDPRAIGTLDVHLVRGDGADVGAYLEPNGETAIEWPYAISDRTTFHLRDNLRGHGYTVSAKFGHLEVATSTGELLHLGGEGGVSITPQISLTRCLQALKALMSPSASVAGVG